MIHKVYKWFWAWDFEKEEKWLNEMAIEGQQLISVGFCRYVFEDSSKEKYNYKLELLENTPSNFESRKYIAFLEETGVEYIGSIMRWAYFRKKVDNGSFEIYSDIDSKIKHYRRIMTLLLAVMPINIWNVISTLNNYIKYRHSTSLVIFIIASLLMILLGVGALKISKKVRNLKKEKVIRE